MNDLSETINKAADLVHRLTGPVCDDIGAMISDSMKPYRAKNLINTLRKTERILREAGLPANAVPTRLLFPIVEASSIEDNETLQEMWAGLLATASQQTDSVSPSFAETLKQMTPDEARRIDEIYGDLTDSNKPHLTLNQQAMYGFRDKAGAINFLVRDTYERLGIICREYSLTTRTEDGEAEVGYLFHFTKYGMAFLAACRGPRRIPK